MACYNQIQWMFACTWYNGCSLVPDLLNLPEPWSPRWAKWLFHMTPLNMNVCQTVTNRWPLTHTLRSRLHMVQGLRGEVQEGNGQEKLHRAHPTFAPVKSLEKAVKYIYSLVLLSGPKLFLNPQRGFGWGVWRQNELSGSWPILCFRHTSLYHR